MSLPSWAVPGAKVVCVDADSPGTRGSVWYPEDAIVTGETYTIFRVWNDFDGPVCSLVGRSRHRASNFYEREVGYHLRRFRPVVDTTTDDEVEQRLFRKKRLHQPVSARLTA
jgi:hypothetical protein